MKTFSKVYRWILLAVLVQFCGLLYINNVILNTNVEVNVKNVAATTKKEPTTGNFKVSDGAENISLSYNAKYGAYLTGGKLHIVDIDKEKDKEVAGTGQDKISFFRWLPDRNMVIYSSDSKDGKKGIIQMSTYEADSETARDYPEISDLTSKSQVMDIELSPFTNVVYAKIKTSSETSKVIRFNVMSQYARVMSLGADAIIKECMYTNKLAYQDKGKSAYIYDGINKTKNKITINKDNISVLDVDLNDNLYVGVLDDTGNVTEIYYQKVEDQQKLTDNWTQITLKESVPAEKIKILSPTSIYIDKADENKIENLVNGNKASYRGQFIEVLDGVLVSKNENKVYVTSLKEY